jgi:hypothetical protein
LVAFSFGSSAANVEILAPIIEVLNLQVLLFKKKEKKSC